MEKCFKNKMKMHTAGFMGALALLLFICSNLVLTGCKKDRLFTHVDSTAAVPPQFHFFNTFSYDKSLLFAVDGLTRETVKEFGFSNYYPSSSAFNLNSQQPNSKLININDPVNNTLYANSPDNSTFQFKPNTSYIVFPTSLAYDTVSRPVNTTVPTLVYYPEDIYHPFDGTTGIRFFNCIAAGNGSPNIDITVTPNIGQGTTNRLTPIYTVIQPVTAAASYVNTQAGLKKVVMTINENNITIQLAYLPVELYNSKNYSFFAVGDFKNFLAGTQPKPRLFLVEDGNSANTRELTLSSTSYPNNLSTLANITVVNDAYNIPGLITIGDYNAGTLVQYSGLDVQFNQTVINVVRWPLLTPPGGGPLFEDINDSESLIRNDGSYPLNLLQRISTNSVTPGSYLVNVLPGKAFSPNYGSFTYNFQQGLNYTVCLLPNNNSSKKLSQLILENDQSPDNNLFKLRIINIMGGTSQIDVHSGSPSGPIIARAVSYGQQNDYLSLKPNLSTQNLYITAAGSTQALFQTGTKNIPISVQFTPGNSGTLYLMGLLPGTTYSGDSGSFGPYVYYNSDAFINANTVLPSSQLFF